MTLVEVIGGLALLASLLAGILAVKAKYTRQAHVTERRREAVAAADGLLSSWWQDPATLPRTGAGRVEGHPGLRWRTHTLDNLEARKLGTQVVRLEVSEDGPAVGGPPLASVELLLPEKVPDAQSVHPR